jgi:saccharopine dehydrogenase-like NADP-dependent oxidoreductase
MDLVILGSGVVGRHATEFLAGSQWISNILLGDIFLEKAKRVASSLPSDKVSIQKINAGNFDQVLEVLKGKDLVINSALPEFNLTVMKAALECGAHYIDLVTSGLNEQTSLCDEFKDANLLALLGFGVSPGLTNMLARKSADQLDRLYEIHLLIRGPGGGKFRDYPFAPIFSPKTFLEEWLSPALIYKNGEFKKLPPLSGEEVFRFPEPIGLDNVYYAFHDEVETFPRYIRKGLRTVDFKYNLGPEAKQALEALSQLGFAKKELVVKGQKIEPIDVVAALLPDPKEVLEEMIESKKYWGCIVVETMGEKEGKETCYTYYILVGGDKLGTPPGTGTCTAIAAESLARGEIKVRGVVPPECLEPEPILSRIFEEYKQAGREIVSRVTTRT